jgi:hypothetical protein
MRVVISGGSNSVRKKGWTADLTSRLPVGTAVVNLSVGASTSTMGAWRMMTTGGLRPGDVLIWEYAVNDRNHIGKSDTTAETLLRHIEHVICMARDAGARMLAVGLVSRAQTSRGSDPYLLSLQRLFGHYCIPLFDAAAPLPGGPLGQGDFDDPNHVAVGGRVIGALINWLIERLATSDEGTVKPVEPLFRGPRRLIQLDEFQPNRVESFRNALLDLQVRRIAEGKTGLAVTNGTAMRVEVQGLAILAERRSGVLRITIGGQTRYVATGLGEQEAKGTLLRFLSFEATGGTLVLKPDEMMLMTWGVPRTAALALRLPGRLGQLAAQASNLVPVASRIHRDIGFSRQIQRNPSHQGGSRIAAVLAETL